MKEFSIDRNTEGQRIDRYLSDELEDRSRSYIQKIMKEGYVKVNQKPVKSNYRLSFGDSVEVTLPEAKEPDIVPENIPLDILYEDQDIIMINKPKQMVVHPAPGHYSGTLVNALMYHCGDELSGINGCMRPGIVHRIDMDTTGSLVVCKNDKAHQSLSEQLKVHSIRRIYVAIVHGNIKEDSGTVNAPIGRHPTDRKKMSTHCKTDGMQSHIIKFWSDSAITHIFSANLKPGVHIRFASIWQVSDILWLVMRSMVRKNAHSKDYRGRPCTHAHLESFIQPQENIWK